MERRILARPAAPHLRPFVRRVWASDEPTPRGATHDALERVLPTGLFHVVVRLSDEPLWVFDEQDGRARSLACAVVGGARTRAYVKRPGAPAATVGALLEPWAAALFFSTRACAEELAGEHTPLEDVWPHGSVAALRERLAELPTPEARLVAFESALAERMGRAPAAAGAIAYALRSFTGRGPVPTVAELAARSGYGVRRFGTLFLAQVGLAPKAFLRVERLQRAVTLLSGKPTTSLAAVALDAGFADQAHLTRELAAIAGLTPGAYRALGPSSPNHVPIADSFKTLAPRAR